MPMLAQTPGCRLAKETASLLSVRSQPTQTSFVTPAASALLTIISAVKSGALAHSSLVVRSPALLPADWIWQWVSTNSKINFQPGYFVVSPLGVVSSFGNKVPSSGLTIPSANTPLIFSAVAGRNGSSMSAISSRLLAW